MSRPCATSKSPRSRRIASPTRMPGDGQQPDQRLVGRGAQRVAQRAGGRDQRGDLLARSRGRASRARSPAGSRPAGGTSVAGSMRLQVAGEAAHHGQPVRAPRGSAPAGSVAHASASSVVIVSAAGALQVGDELGKQLAVRSSACSRARDEPAGSRRAPARSGLMPHLPATAVRASAAPRGPPSRRSRWSDRRRWRSTWPISGSGAPALSISVAAVWRSRCAPMSPSPARRPAAITTLRHPAGAQRPVRRPDAHEHAASLARSRDARGADSQRRPARHRPAAAAAPGGCPCRGRRSRPPASPCPRAAARRPRRCAARAAPSSVRIAKSRRPAVLRRSQPANRRPSWPASSARGKPASRQRATEGTAPANGPRISPCDMQEAQQGPQRGHHAYPSRRGPRGTR